MTSWSYIRLNPRTHTPVGLGRLEVAFETIHEFLGAHRYAARTGQQLRGAVRAVAAGIGSDATRAIDSVVARRHRRHRAACRFFRWRTSRRYCASGRTRMPICAWQWQQFLMRVIADAFDLPPMFLGLEADVNRSTAGQISGDAFQTAIVPTARLFAEHLTRDVIVKRLGWHGPGVRLHRSGCDESIGAGTIAGDPAAQWRADDK